MVIKLKKETVYLTTSKTYIQVNKSRINNVLSVCVYVDGGQNIAIYVYRY